MRESCDIILRPHAGARVSAAFADARDLAALMQHDVTVAGNNLFIVVTPQMDEAECRFAYESALLGSSRSQTSTEVRQ